MVSAAPPAQIDFINPMINWIQQNRQIVIVTAIALIALGITAVFGVATLTVSIAFSTSLAAILVIAAALSFATSAFLAYQIIRNIYFQPQAQIEVVQGSPPNIALNDATGQKNYRIQIMNDTLQHLKAGFYTSPDGTQHTLDLTRSAQGAELLFSAGSAAQQPGNEHTRILVKNQDCLYAAAELNLEGLNPIVLDMANNGHFGGGYLTGARAQEEDCCRRTGLCLAGDMQHGVQRRNFYPLSHPSNSAGIYIPYVPIFRAGYEKGYQYLNRPFEVAFGVIAASNNPPIDFSSGMPRLPQTEAATVREKIRTFFEMARQHGHKSVVFSALGCGAFRNPPDHIAELTMDVINNEFAHCFNKVVIAIIDDHNTGGRLNPEGNFKPFARRALASGGSAFDANGQEITGI